MLSNYIKQDKFFLTLVSNKTGVSFCYKVVKKDNVYFVNVLTGTLLEKYFSFIGYYKKEDLKKLLFQKSDRKTADSTEFKAFEYFLKNLDTVENNPNLKILKKYIAC